MARSESTPRYTGSLRLTLTWVAGTLGLLAYNWWLLVPLRPGLLRSPDEFFSNLEVPGQPYASAMQHADLVSGLLLLLAFLAVGSRSIIAGRGEWLGMVVFAVSGALGGAFAQTCADGIDASCRAREWAFQLPLLSYTHAVAGIGEFAGITVALVLAVRRTWGGQAMTARVYRGLAGGAALAYPLLGLAYLFNVGGAVIQAAFFTGFTVMAAAQFAERTRWQPR